jgi:WD40 repeat protein
LIAEGGLRQPVPQGSEIEFGVSPVCVGKLVNAYLVRMEEQRGTLWYRLAHDRLVDAVRSDNARWNAENLSLLQRQALLWEREGRPDRLLLTGADLVEAENWHEGEHEELNSIETDLMERSREQHREREAAREKERQSNRRIRRYLLAAVSVAVLAVLALLFAVWAWGQAQTNSLEAQNQRNAAKTAQFEAEGQKQTAQFNFVQAENERAKAEANRILADEKAQEALDEKNRAATAQVRAEAGEARAQEALVEVERLATAAVQEQAAALSQRLAFDAQQIASSDPDLAALLSVAAYKASRTTAATNMLISSIYTSTVTIETDKTIGGFTSDIYSLAISPDEKTLAVGGRDGKVYVLNLEAENPIPLILPASHTNTVNGLAFSPDGELLASSGSDGRLIIFGKNPIAQSSEWTFREYKLIGGSSGLSFRPDGLKLAVAESFEYSVFDVFPGKVELGRKTSFLRGRKNGYIHDIAFSPDGLRLAVSHQGETGDDLPDWVIIYNAETGGREYLNDDHTEFIPSLAWSVDNRTLVSVSLDGRIIASDVLFKTTQIVEKAHNSNTIYGVSTSYDGKYVVTGGWDGYTRVWSLPDLQPLGGEPNTDLQLDVLTVAFSPHSYLFASAGSDRRVIMRRLITQPSLAEPVITADGQVRALSVDPQGQLFWTFLDRFSRRYTTLSTDPNFFYGKPGDIDTAYSVALHPDGKTVAYGGKNGVIYTALTEDPFAEAWPAIPEADEIRGLAFSPDGKQLASSFCAETGKGSRCLQSKILLWDVETRQSREFAVVEDAGLVRALAFSPDGNYLALGAENGLVKVLDLKTGVPLPLNIEPSSSEVLSLAFSKDSKMLAGGNKAGDMLLWDASSNFQDLGRLNVGSGGSLASLAFDLEGTHLYTGGESGEIMNWAISPDLWVDIICQRVGRNLTLDEWRTFFFNEDVQPICPE